MTINKLFFNLNDDPDHESKCYGCNGPIQDPYILQVYPDLQWHMSCLKCTKCQRPLDNESSCYVREGKVYCKEDYLSYFLYRCAGCYETIKKSEFVMRVRSHTYHVACFKCSICQKSLQPGEEIAFRNNFPYCLADANFSFLPKLSTPTGINPASGLGQEIKQELEVSPGSNQNSLRKSLMNSSTEDGSLLEELKLGDDIDEMTDRSNVQFDEIKEYLNLKPSCKLSGKNEDSVSNTSRPQSPLSSLGQSINNINKSPDEINGHKFLKNLPNPGMPFPNKNNGSLASDPEEADSDEDFYDDLEDLDDENGSLLGNVHASSTGSGGPHGHLGSHGVLNNNKFLNNGGNRQPFLHSGSSSASSNHNRAFMGSKVQGNGKRSKEQKTTRVRTVLNEKQLHMLRTCYAANPRPDALMKEQLVEMTGLSPRVIRVWFQNKRCKDKKKQILIKQMEQHHQAGQISCTLQGVPMVASSPVPNDASMLNSGSSVEIQQFSRSNWPNKAQSDSKVSPIDENPGNSLTVTSLSGKFTPTGARDKMTPKFPPISQIGQNGLPMIHSSVGIQQQAQIQPSDSIPMGGDNVPNFTQLQSQSPMNTMHFSRISQAT